MSSVPSQQIIALNDAESSENRIHSDDIALKFGFTGALVSGVNVFGYLSQPLVQTFGVDWLSRGIFDVIFLKPAYHGNLLNIRSEAVAESEHARHYLTTAVNDQHTVLAKLHSWLPQELPAINPLASMKPRIETSERPEISWDVIHLQQPAPVFLWQPTVADNQQRIDAQRDPAALYLGAHGYLHPYYLLDACNKALMRQFVLPAWIHTGSRLILRKPLRVGQAIEVHAIPIQKWQRKGHQFIKLYIAMCTGGEVALEAEHSAIFRIAQ